jgi:hypothetical protein
MVASQLGQRNLIVIDRSLGLALVPSGSSRPARAWTSSPLPRSGSRRIRPSRRRHVFGYTGGMDDDEHGEPRYFSTWGPLDGPIRAIDVPPALGVVADPDAPPMPIGMAFAVDQVPHRGGSLAVFQLTIGKAEILGRWVCDRRQFVELVERGPVREGDG